MFERLIRNSAKHSTVARVLSSVILYASLGIKTALAAATLVAPFDSDYSITDLGAIPDVPLKYGGLTLKFDDLNTLLVGGEANAPTGKLYAVSLTRNNNGQIIGFNGAATVFAEAAYNDGGVTYGPNKVLFLARWPQVKLGQTIPGSTVTDKIIDLAALGVGGGGPGGLMFVPPGFASAGAFKLMTWPSGLFYTLELTADGSGTYNVSKVTDESITLAGGPEGFVYIDANNPQLTADSMLVSEYTANKVAIYEIDSAGNPVTTTRRDFIVGLNGAEGAFVDPLTGDFLFSTFNNVATVIAVRGFLTPPSPTPDAFSFPAISNAEPGEIIISDSVTVSGINTSIPIAISNGEYSLNDGVYTTATGLANNGDTVTVRVTSSSIPGETLTVTLTLGAGAGAVSQAFSITTAAASTAPSKTNAGGGGGGGNLGLLETMLLMLALLFRRLRIRITPRTNKDSFY